MTEPWHLDPSVKKLYLFFGRHAEIAWINEQLVRGQQLMAVYGPHRIGKTSLLHALIDRLPQEYLPVYLDADKADGWDATSPILQIAGEVGRKVREQSPEAYDAILYVEQHADGAAFVRCVTAAANEPELAAPCYDRRLHDPVPGGIRIGPGHCAVIVEGNYLLLDRPPWAPISRALDLALYLDVSADVVREAMIARHIRGGRTPDDAAAHFERVDRLNYETCAASAHRADLILRRDAAQAIAAVDAPI